MFCRSNYPSHATNVELCKLNMLGLNMLRQVHMGIVGVLTLFTIVYIQHYEDSTQVATYHLTIRELPYWTIQQSTPLK